MDHLTHLLLSALLVTLLLSGWYISRQFQRMRDSYRRLEAMLLALAQAERRAQQTLQALTHKNAEVESHMAGRVMRIGRLVEQLELMARRGSGGGAQRAQADPPPVV